MLILDEFFYFVENTKYNTYTCQKPSKLMNHYLRLRYLLDANVWFQKDKFSNKRIPKMGLVFLFLLFQTDS